MSQSVFNAEVLGAQVVAAALLDGESISRSLSGYVISA